MPAELAEHDCFANGVTEDLITALSSIRWLFVIARISSDSMNRIVHWLRSNGSARTSRSPWYESTTSFRIPMTWRTFLPDCESPAYRTENDATPNRSDWDDNESYRLAARRGDTEAGSWLRVDLHHRPQRYACTCRALTRCDHRSSARAIVA